MPYIYVLRDPGSGLVRYVGKANDVQHRFNVHKKQAEGKRLTFCSRWIRGLILQGQEPIVEVIEEVSEREWPNAERKWIAHYLSINMPLTNMTVGGDGAIPTELCEEEFRRRISEGVKRKALDPEWRWHCGDFLRGKHLTPEWRAKIGESNKGRVTKPESIRKCKETWRKNNKPRKPASEETRRKLSKALKGRKFSEETRAKLSAARKGKKTGPMSEESKAKLRAVFKGRIISGETRAKMSATKQGWHPSPELTHIQREKCSGEGNGRAILTAEQVREIRAVYGNGERPSYAEIGKRYGVTLGVIFRILKGKSWKRV